MTETPTTRIARPSRLECRILLALFAVTVLVHGLFGFVYATRLSPQLLGRLSSARGEAYLQGFPGWNTDSELDSTYINRTALSILRRGLPYSRQGTLVLRTAVYSYFVAACYALGGVRLLPLVVAQAVLSGLTGFIFASAAGRLLGGRKFIRAIVATLYLVNLRVAMYVGYVTPLVLTLLFTALAFWGLARWKDRRSPLWIVLGLVLGTYTSSTFFTVALAGASWLLLWRRSFLGFWAITLFVALKFLVTFSNMAGSGIELGRAGDRGAIFWLSNNPYYERMRPWDLWEWRPENQWSTWKMTADERDRHEAYLARSGQNELRATLLWIRENPGSYAQVCLARLRTEFGPYTGEMSPRNRLISTLIWLLVFPAGFYCLWQLRHDPAGQFVALVVIAVFASGTFVSEEPYLRYRMPVDLLLTALAGGSYALWSGRRTAEEP